MQDFSGDRFFKPGAVRWLEQLAVRLMNFRVLDSNFVAWSRLQLSIIKFSNTHWMTAFELLRSSSYFPTFLLAKKLYGFSMPCGIRSSWKSLKPWCSFLFLTLYSLLRKAYPCPCFNSPLFFKDFTQYFCSEISEHNIPVFQFFYMNVAKWFCLWCIQRSSWSFRQIFISSFSEEVELLWTKLCKVDPRNGVWFIFISPSLCIPYH